MFGCWATSTIRGVRMHCEQSSVGNVSESWPCARRSRGPLDQDDLVPGVRDVERRLDPGDAAADDQRAAGDRHVDRWSGWLRLTFSTIIRTRSMAFSVVVSVLRCTHEQCSRRLAISQRNGFRPAPRSPGGRSARASAASRPRRRRRSSRCSLIACLERSGRGRSTCTCSRCVDDAGQRPRRLGHRRAVDRAADVLAAVTDEDADPGHDYSSPTGYDPPDRHKMPVQAQRLWRRARARARSPA